MKIMNRSELKERFGVYLNQIPILVSANADWALLHYIIIFPDICGALEQASGQGLKGGKSYMNWAQRYLEDAVLNAEEWYEMRCLLLHQGITLGRGRYAKYSYKSPSTTNIKHKQIIGGTITLDVHALKEEIMNGLEKWFIDIESRQNIKASVNVEKNIKAIATILPVHAPGSPTAILGGPVISGATTTSYISPNQF